MEIFLKKIKQIENFQKCDFHEKAEYPGPLVPKMLNSFSFDHFV